MTTFTASISIEAADPAAAADIVATWTLSRDATLLSIVGVPEFTEGLPVKTFEDGSIRHAMNNSAAAARDPEHVG